MDSTMSPNPLPAPPAHRIPSIEPRSPTPSKGPDICIVCLHPSAIVIREKRKGTHPTAGHVVGLTPEQCHQEFSSSLSWSIMQWQCAECGVTWFSYYFFHDVYDGRWHGKHESPTQLARKAQAKGTLQSWPTQTSSTSRTHTQSASPERSHQRPKRPRIDTGTSIPPPRFSNTPPMSTTSVTAAHNLATSSPFVIGVTVPSTHAPLASMDLGESSIASEYSRLYSQSQSASPATHASTRRPQPPRSRRPSSSQRSRSPRARPSRHERNLSNVLEEPSHGHPISSQPQSGHLHDGALPSHDVPRLFDPHNLSPGASSVTTNLNARQPISPPRSATESRPLSAGVSDDQYPGDQYPNDHDADASEHGIGRSGSGSELGGRHHRRGSNFDLDNFNRIRRFGACEWCRKRKKKCSVNHHLR